MALRSQLLTVDLPDNNGKVIPYYTYDGYLDEQDRHTIRAETRNFQKFAVTGFAIFGFLGYFATRKFTLPVIHIKGWSIPTSGLLSGIVAGELGYQLFSLYGSSRLTSIKRDIAFSAKHLPLWSNLRYAVNPDRAFFELADERHNQPLIFHSGLNPEAAAKLIPDKIIGTIPHKPHAPTAHDNGHGHH